MKARKLLLFLCAFTLIAFASGCAKKDKITLGTGGIGGNYYSYGNTISQIATEELGLEFAVKTTAGSAANLRLLNQGFVNAAIVQSDTLAQALTGTGVFEGNKLSGIHALAGLYTECCQIIVSDSSNINSVSDLKGTRISIGEKDSGVVENAKKILLSYGINISDITASYLSFSASAEAMKNGEIDAFFVTSAAPTSAVSELAKEMDVHLLSLDERTISYLKAVYDYYTDATIPAGTYKGQDEDITTIGVKSILVASDKLSDESAEKLTEMLFDKASDIQYSTGINATDTNMATKDIPADFHKGASNYYSKKGIEVVVGTNGKINYGIIAGQD